MLPLVERLDVQMFNRITEVEIDYLADLSIRLGKHDVSELDHLDHIALKRVFSTPANRAIIDELKESLPCSKIKLEPEYGKIEILTCSM